MSSEDSQKIDIKIDSKKSPAKQSSQDSRLSAKSDTNKSQPQQARSQEKVIRTTGYGGGGYGTGSGAGSGVATADISGKDNIDSDHGNRGVVKDDETQSKLQQVEEEDFSVEDIYSSRMDLDEDIDQSGDFSDIARSSRRKKQKQQLKTKKPSSYKVSVFSSRRFWVVVFVFLSSLIAGLIMLYQLEQAREGAGIIFDWF